MLGSKARAKTNNECGHTEDEDVVTQAIKLTKQVSCTLVSENYSPDNHVIVSPLSNIASSVDRVSERRPYQSSSISIHGGTSFASSRISHDPPSPYSASDAFGDSIIHSPLPKPTRRQPPNILVSIPENQFNAMPPSSAKVEDSPCLSLMMGDSHPGVGDDVIPVIRTGLNGLKRMPISNPEQPSPYRSSGMSLVDNILYKGH